MREAVLAVSDGKRPLCGWETLAMACAAGLLTVDGAADCYAVTDAGRAVANEERDLRDQQRARARVRGAARREAYADLGMKRNRNGGYE